MQLYRHGSYRSLRFTALHYDAFSLSFSRTIFRSRRRMDARASVHCSRQETSENYPTGSIHRPNANQHGDIAYQLETT